MDDLGPQLLLQFLLIGMNAFFAASEMAMVSLNVNKLKKDAEDGDVKAAKMLKLAEEPTSFLSAIQIAITLAGFLGSAFAAENFSDKLVNWIFYGLNFTKVPLETLDAFAVIVITLVLSFFTLVLGELLPKRIAMHSPLKVARFTTPVVRGVAIVMKPVIWLLSISTAGLLRLFGIKDQKEEEKVTEDEIRLMVDIGEETGTIDAKEREMIDNIFELDNSTAKDVMTRSADVISIALDATEDEILDAIRNNGFSRMPVYENEPGNVVGFLIAKEYLLNMKSDEPMPVSEIMRPAYFVPETVACNDLLSKMQKEHKHMAMVVDEYGDVIGLITIEDLIEEILGNIYDEFDDAEAAEAVEAIVELGEGNWRIAGEAEIDVVAEKLEIEIPEEITVNTFGGLVMSCLDEIPEDGSTFEVETSGLHVKVDNFNERRVESAVVTRVPTVENDEEAVASEAK